MRLTTCPRKNGRVFTAIVILLVFECYLGDLRGIFKANSAIAATTFPSKDKEGKTIWRSPIMDASSWEYRSHKGRVGITTGDDNALLDENTDPYASKI